MGLEEQLRARLGEALDELVAGGALDRSVVRSAWINVEPPRDSDLTPGWKHRWDRDKTLGRLLWVEAIRTVYQSEQELLGISAPKRMIREENDQEGGSAET